MKWPFQKIPGEKVQTAKPSGPSIEALRELYRVMFQARCIDETEATLVARGEAFFHVSGAGHEASAVLNFFLHWPVPSGDPPPGMEMARSYY